MNVQLDNRIFAMQQKNLPKEIAAVVTQADIAYLQDRDNEAEYLITNAEAMLETYETAIIGQCELCGELLEEGAPDDDICGSCLCMIINMGDDIE